MRGRDLSSSAPTTPDSRERSSAASFSDETTISSFNGPHLHQSSKRGVSAVAAATAAVVAEIDRLSPLLEDDPQSFNLLAPAEGQGDAYSLESGAVQLFSREHLQSIFAEPASLQKYTSFLSSYRPQSVPVLLFYFDALKALRAINYANSIADSLEPIEGFDFTEHPPRPTVNTALEEKASLAFEAMVRDDLPAYITNVFTRIVSQSVKRKINGSLAPHVHDVSEGLAEVFCLSDPSRFDNPIVFASEGKTCCPFLGHLIVFHAILNFLICRISPNHPVWCQPYVGA